MEAWVNFVILGIFVVSLVGVIILIKIEKLLRGVQPWPPIDKILDKQGRFKADVDMASKLGLPMSKKDRTIGNLANSTACAASIIMHMLNRR